MNHIVIDRDRKRVIRIRNVSLSYDRIKREAKKTKKWRQKSMLNVTTMTGRLVRDPEMRSTAGGTPVTTISIAVDRDYAKEGEDAATDFFDVVAWRGTAEFICKYFTKGKLITVVGRIENRSWTDKHDQKRVSTELLADKVYFCGSKPNDDSGKDGSPSSQIDPFADDAPADMRPATPFD